MNANQKKKHKLFELFSKNLEFVKQHPKIEFKPDFKNGYICPLCFDVFFKENLANSSENFLTLEDIPPIKLGGKVRALTCKKCNSSAGHTLDNNLLNKLTEIDFQSFLPNSETDTTFSFNGNRVNGTIKIDDKGSFDVNLQPERSNPKESDKFIKDVFPPTTLYSPIHKLLNPDFVEPIYKTKTFNFQKVEKSNKKRAEIALLRIAYLYAFSIFGNGFLINRNLYKIREQIQNPDKEILHPVFWINYKFPEEMIGVNIIKKPKELRCFLVVFNLKTKSSKRQFAICLPGPTEPGIEIYKNLDKFLCSGTGFVDMDTEHIDEKELITRKGYEMASTYYWKKIANA